MPIRESRIDPRGGRRDSTNGFTLIEVLISLAILVIVLGAVYSSFFLCSGRLKGSTIYHSNIMRQERPWTL